MPDEKQNLDGSTPIKPIPFDAHERATRGEHVPTELDSPDPDLSNIQEFPKAVDHVDHPSGVGKQPVVVNSAEEEAEYHDAKEEVESTASPEPANDEELVKALLAARKRISQLDAAVDQGSDALFSKDAEIGLLNKRIAGLEARIAEAQPKPGPKLSDFDQK